jgi:hypothetical protein
MYQIGASPFVIAIERGFGTTERQTSGHLTEFFYPVVRYIIKS